MADSALTHSIPTHQHACAVYTVPIQPLVTQPGDADGAITAALRYTEAHVDSEVHHWIREAFDVVDPGYTPDQGFIRYGFTHDFRHLAQRTNYADAIHETLLGGGDNDTNACIVGGMIGVLHGVDGIPDRVRLALLQCDTEKARPRPSLLQTKIHLPQLIHKIVS